jgi:hypothetical protein
VTRRSRNCHIAFSAGLVLMIVGMVAEIWSQWTPPVVLSAISLRFRAAAPDGSVKPGAEADFDKWGWWYRECEGVSVETITNHEGKPWVDPNNPRFRPIDTSKRQMGPLSGRRKDPWVVPAELPDGHWLLNVDSRMWCWIGERLSPIQTPRVQAAFTVRR